MIILKASIFPEYVEAYVFYTETFDSSPNKKPPNSYVLVETVGVEPTSKDNGT